MNRGNHFFPSHNSPQTMKLYNWSFSSTSRHSFKMTVMSGCTSCLSGCGIFFTAFFLVSTISQSAARMLQMPLHYRQINVQPDPFFSHQTSHFRERRDTKRDAPRHPAPPPTSGSLMGRSGQGYYITIYIGTPPQQLNVLVDTGSSNLAVAAYPNPLVTTYFHTENSMTIEDLGIIVNVPYTQGDWKGKLVQDMVSLSILPNVSVPTQLACITESRGFFINDSNWQGILGLAYAKIARPDSSIVPFFDSLLSSYNVEDVFSIQMCGTVPDNSSSTELRMAGTMIIGGVDESLYEGPLFTSPIFREWYYEIVITDMEVNGNSLRMDCKEYNFDKTIVDSGTTNLRLPMKVHAKVVNRMKRYVVLPGLHSRPSDEFWAGTDSLCWHSDEVPYGSFPSLTITLAHQDDQVFKLVLSPQQYLRHMPGVSTSELDSCYKFSVSNSDSGTVLGAVVMEAFYTVFNRKNRTIGFGQSNCSIKNKNTMTSYIEGMIPYKGNASQCAYMRSIEENSTLVIVAYVMGGICAVCIIPLILLIIQCQLRQCRRGKPVRDDADHRPLHEDSS